MSCFYLRQSELRKDLSPRLKLNLFRHGSRFRMSHRAATDGNLLGIIYIYLSFSLSLSPSCARIPRVRDATRDAAGRKYVSTPCSPEISKEPVRNFGNGFQRRGFDIRASLPRISIGFGPSAVPRVYRSSRRLCVYSRGMRAPKSQFFCFRRLV